MFTRVEHQSIIQGCFVCIPISPHVFMIYLAFILHDLAFPPLPLKRNVSLLHRAGKVGRIHDGVLLLLLYQPHDVLRHGRCRSLARDFDPVCEEFYCTVAGDVYVAVFGFHQK
jgi:hypothetical protein